MEVTVFFIQIFIKACVLFSPILFTFLVLIIGLGQVVGRCENWSRFEAFYWSFITAFTVGYGDIRPERIFARMLTLIISIVGIMFTGMLVSITVACATRAFNEFYPQYFS